MILYQTLIMFSYNSNVFWALIGFSFLSIQITNASDNCDVKWCTGPSYYYEELGCIPIYVNASSCCPTRYICDHWKNLPDNKCFANGHVYDKREMLHLGEIGGCTRCWCNGGNSNPICMTSSCAGPPPGCFMKLTPYDCCPIGFFCPKENESIPNCTVDGKTYNIGESFVPLAEPEKVCYCGEGYTGLNVEPFCVSRKPVRCGNAIFAVEKIRNNCAPIYAHDRSPHNECNRGFRCYDPDTDFVVRRNPEEISETEELDSMCKFGNLTLRVGDVLSSSTEEGSNMTCACEVPPVVICRDLV